MLVEFTVQQPTLLQTLREVPSSRIIWEQKDTTENDEELLLFWAESDDFDAFESALYDDPTVTAPRRLTEFSDRRLYQVEHVGEGRAQSVYSSMVEVGGIVQQATATREGWRVQALFPDNDALTHFHDACSEYDLGFTLRRKYEEADDHHESDSYGLTEKQRKMLRHAVDEGYYEVPRATDLDTLAEDLDISHQAASERLRRAVDLLVRHSIAPEDESTEAVTAPQRAE
ncbi:helix-turn-helix domain-containing protein [Halomarina salina]|uniref:Helix-turn-helix domain-containing protein n=1 Tax=Halomarina salina TaxID=1872699 RepID=A0ABD5RRT0_9EURY|nr:helix-turn-helix domain-containing protein [Halomarina salina]